MNTEKIGIELVAAEADPPLRSNEYQTGLQEVASALRATGAGVSFRVFMQEAVDAQSFLLGGFTVENLKNAGLVLGPIIGAWLQAHYGRRVRLKVGDIEAEARNVAELGQLLEKAEGLRPRN
jgi:hypothetical protein